MGASSMFAMKVKLNCLSCPPPRTTTHTHTRQIKDVWDNSAIGIALEKTTGLGADFDGDECNVMLVSDPGSIAEVRYLLASKYNAKTYSGDTNIKLVPPHDAVLAFTYCVLHPQEKFWLCRERGL